MEELREIMAALTEIEYGMDCLIKILEVLEEFYELKHEHETHANITVLVRQISSLHTDLAEEISNIDGFLINCKNA